MTPASKAITLALRGLRREWHAGELHVLIAAIVIAVASMTAVGFFTDRVERAMLAQASELLAADTLLQSSRDIPTRFELMGREFDLQTARTLSFRSVLVSGERMELAEVKAVSDAYPLRGDLRTADEPYGVDQVVKEVPPAGTIWLDSRLMSTLELRPGDKIALGDIELEVQAVLSYEPDRGGDLFSIAPRALMHYDDVAASGLVQPGSRVTHSLLYAGPPENVARFRSSVTGKLEEGQKFYGVRDARPELKVALERAEQFLGLAALVAVLLSGAAIAVSSRRYVERRLDMAALMRCLGASQNFITALFVLQIAIIGLVASLAGSAVGFAAQQVLVNVFSGLLTGDLPPVSAKPVVFGLLTGIATLAGFALPPLLRLRDVSPARVIRRDLGAAPPRTWTAYGLALAAMAGLILWQAQDTRLGLYVLGATILTLATLTAVATALVMLLKLLRSRVGTSWRFGFANLSRRARGSVLQIVAFGLGFMMLMLLTVVRSDILDEWQRSLPADAPNYFLVNIQPDDVASLDTFLSLRGLDNAELYPMIRGRLRHINEHAVSRDDYEDVRAQRLATREFNLSWAHSLKTDNRVTSGRWWTGDELQQPLFSVEEGLAATLGIKMGDRLTFNVAGQDIEGTVSNLRFVEWDSFEVNFFVVAPPALLETAPATFISSFHLPVGDRRTLIELVREFPSVTVLDVDALLSKVRQIMDQAVVGVQYVFLFTILAGIVVLIAAVQSTMDERRHETAIIRTLGGQRRTILRGLLAEFLTLGVLAGFLAAVVANVVGSVVARQIFQLDYQGDASLWIVGVVAGGLGTSIAGMLSARSAIEHSPLQTLRAA